MWMCCSRTRVTSHARPSKWRQIWCHQRVPSQYWGCPEPHPFVFLQCHVRECIGPICNITLKSTLNHCVTVIDKVMLFVLLGNLLVRVHFSVVENLGVALTIRISLVDRTVKMIFQMEWHIAPIWSLPFEIILRWWPPSDLLARFKNSSDAETISDYFKDNDERTQLLRAANALQYCWNRGMCTSHNQQRWSHLHGATPELDAKSIGPSGLKD